MIVEVSREGVTVDLLVWQALHSTDATIVVQVLELNPGLADLGLFVPPGTRVLLPEPAAPVLPVRPSIRLWG